MGGDRLATQRQRGEEHDQQADSRVGGHLRSATAGSATLRSGSPTELLAALFSTNITSRPTTNQAPAAAAITAANPPNQRVLVAEYDQPGQQYHRAGQDRGIHPDGRQMPHHVWA